MAEAAWKALDLVDMKVKPASGKDDYERTTWMYLQNDTPALIKIAFFQATCRYDLPQPYIKDTGTFIAGIDGAPGGSIAVDPWDAGGRNAPIAATAAFGTCKARIENYEQDVTLKPYPEAPEGEYYPQIGWRLTVESVVSLEGTAAKVIVARQITAGTSRRTEPTK